MDPGRAPLRVVPSLVDPDEEAAASACADLDLDTAFRLHSRYVAGIALRLLGRESDVDDVVQDVFLSAIRGLSQLRDPGAVRGWLATVTVRVARRRLKMRRLRAMIGLDEAHDYRELAVPGTRAEDRVFLARVYAALDGVPADHRIAWVLRHVAGEDLDTIAKKCGSSLATVKRHIANAHAAVEELVHDE